MTPVRKNFFSPTAFWAACAILMIAANIYSLWPAYKTLLGHPRAPYAAPGEMFLIFKPYLKNIPEIGYLTDKDMSPENNDGLFLQAQYALAPVLLDLNDPQHKLLLIDPAHILSAMDLTRDLPVEFLIITPENKILAKRK